ncbi:hypothetical protein DFH27DRAFT_37633 [Peziza echinospora]|nr:hypothetical protein DFH27DRAFT_37633 [Peziza echinospora]
MDFAPYQSSPPEASRQSLNIARPYSPQITTPPYLPPKPTLGPSSTSTPPLHNSNTPQYDPWGGSPNGGGGGGSGGFSGGLGGFGAARETVDQFETSLPIRLDYEAMLAYILLPPAGGVLLLILEHKSDYVRFHAWQSSLLFTALAILHFILSFSSFLSYTLLLCDLGLIGWLTVRAYRDADTLDRCEVPWFGPLASSILDDE